MNGLKKLLQGIKDIDSSIGMEMEDILAKSRDDFSSGRITLSEYKVIISDLKKSVKSQIAIKMISAKSDIHSLVIDVFKAVTPLMGR